MEKATAFVNRILFKQSRDLDERSLGRRATPFCPSSTARCAWPGMNCTTRASPAAAPTTPIRRTARKIAPRFSNRRKSTPPTKPTPPCFASRPTSNPVDLVCYLKREDGSSFTTFRLRRPATGFISQKSLGGRELRALELPGPVERRHEPLEHRVCRSSGHDLQPRKDRQRPSAPAQN